MNPGGTNMSRYLKEYYRWNNMKHDIKEFVAKCLVYYQVNAKHLKPIGLL